MKADKQHYEDFYREQRAAAYRRVLTIFVSGERLVYLPLGFERTASTRMASIWHCWSCTATKRMNALCERGLVLKSARQNALRNMYHLPKEFHDKFHSDAVEFWRGVGYSSELKVMCVKDEAERLERHLATLPVPVVC